MIESAVVSEVLRRFPSKSVSKLFGPIREALCLGILIFSPIFAYGALFYRSATVEMRTVLEQVPTSLWAYVEYASKSIGEAWNSFSVGDWIKIAILVAAWFTLKRFLGNTIDFLREFREKIMETMFGLGASAEEIERKQQHLRLILKNARKWAKPKGLEKYFTDERVQGSIEKSRTWAAPPIVLARIVDLGTNILLLVLSTLLLFRAAALGSLQTRIPETLEAFGNIFELTSWLTAGASLALLLSSISLYYSRTLVVVRLGTFVISASALLIMAPLGGKIRGPEIVKFWQVELVDDEIDTVPKHYMLLYREESTIFVYNSLRRVVVEKKLKNGDSVTYVRKLTLRELCKNHTGADTAFKPHNDPPTTDEPAPPP